MIAKPRTKAELWADLKAKFDEETQIMLMRMGNCSARSARQYLLFVKVLWNNRKKSELGIKQRVTSYANEIGLAGGAQKYFQGIYDDPRWDHFQKCLSAAFMKTPAGRRLKKKINKKYYETHPRAPLTEQQKLDRNRKDRERYQLKRTKAQEAALIESVLEQV